MALSLLLLALITINGGLKYWINVYSGVVGERTLRRMRHDLYQQVLRFPLPQFKTMSAGEIIPMIVAETEPVGGFIGEAVVLPIFQGGLLVTYLVFIFNQDLWLGLAAIALYPPQVYLIPRLQRKINLLVEGSRADGAPAFRSHRRIGGRASRRSAATTRCSSSAPTSAIGSGKIYAIRYDIYKRKFFVKFLNNFLAQITPFFFYSVGGYLVIKGSLSLGALVAVLAAYKDILSPVEGAADLVLDEGGRPDQARADRVAVRAAGHDRPQAPRRSAGRRFRRSPATSRRRRSRTARTASPTGSSG